MPVTLTCFCCGRCERHADVDAAFNSGWARGEHMWNLYTACPPCRWLEGGDETEPSVEQHQDTHRREKDKQRQLSVMCGACEKTALTASFMLRDQPDPRNTFSNGVLHINAGTVVRLTEAQTAQVAEAMAVGDICTVMQIADHVMPYCKECALSYCSEHWHHVREKIGDDNAEVTCPHGHTHMIDE